MVRVRVRGGEARWVPIKKRYINIKISIVFIYIYI